MRINSLQFHCAPIFKIHVLLFIVGSLKMLGIQSWHLDCEKLATADGINERAEAVVNAKVE